jgi:hypothetical protein
VREENAVKYTKKAIEKYKDEFLIYLFQPRKDFYLIKINDNFTASDFKTIYTFFIKTEAEDFTHRSLVLPEFEGVQHFQWYDIGGVELEKTDYNDFGGNIFIGMKYCMELIDIQ